MNPMTVPSAADELAPCATRWAHGRQRRAIRRARRPQALWDHAVAFTGVRPPSRVARRLGLCPHALQNCGGAAPAAPALEAWPTARSGVEVIAAASALATSAALARHTPAGPRRRLAYPAPPPSLAAWGRTVVATP
jgi:hypothetical protein